MSLVEKWNSSTDLTEFYKKLTTEDSKSLKEFEDFLDKNFEEDEKDKILNEVL